MVLYQHQAPNPPPWTRTIMLVSKSLVFKSCLKNSTLVKMVYGCNDPSYIYKQRWNIFFVQIMEELYFFLPLHGRSTSYIHTALRSLKQLWNICITKQQHAINSLKFTRNSGVFVFFHSCNCRKVCLLVIQTQKHQLTDKWRANSVTIYTSINWPVALKMSENEVHNQPKPPCWPAGRHLLQSTVKTPLVDSHVGSGISTPVYKPRCCRQPFPVTVKTD